MSPNVLCTALVTANVFQNVLARHDPRCQYYTDLLRRLSSRSVRWYTTQLDWSLAWTSWDLFGLEVDEACRETYLGMLHKVQPCPVDGSIWELSGDFQIDNFYDALRLAAAIDQGVDAIVTQEPQQFTRTIVEYYRIQVDGYFYIAVPTICAETGNEIELQIGVFSVGAFLLNLDEISRSPVLQTPRSHLFELESFRLVSSDESEATILLRGPTDEPISVTATGKTPFDAIQRAIDEAVNEWYDMPERRLTRFLIRPATLTGADSLVEMVVGVECGDLNFEKSACSGNCMRASADAYVKVINAICDRLSPPVRHRQLE